MPRMNIDFSDDTYDTICRVAQKLKISKKAAIEQCVRNASTMRQKCVSLAGASSPSAQKEINKYNTEAEAVGSDSSKILPYCKDNKNSKKAPRAEPVFMPDPDNWEPQGNFRATWCAAKGYDYAIAIEIFRDIFKADPQRCSDWDSKWRYFLLNGYLKGAKFSELESEEDDYGLPNSRYQPNAL